MLARRLGTAPAAVGREVRAEPPRPGHWLRRDRRTDRRIRTGGMGNCHPGKDNERTARPPPGVLSASTGCPTDVGAAGAPDQPPGAPVPRWHAGPETQKSWRRPMFPKGCPLSIFGAGELNFRVRDGNGCGLSARVTRISCVWMWFGSGSSSRLVPGRGAFKGDRRFRVSRSPRRAEDHHETAPHPGSSDPWSVAEEVKPSTISTAQLHPSPDFHMPPIKQVVSLRSYPVDPVGNLILRRASHLDAFSAYPDRT